MRTQVEFSDPMSGNSQLPRTLAPGARHACDIRSLIHSHKHIHTNKNRSLKNILVLIYTKCKKIPASTPPPISCSELEKTDIPWCCHSLPGDWVVTWLSQRLYRSVYEKNKMKIHIVPDMVEMVTAKDSQKKVSEIDYRLHLHEWICHPDLQVNSHVRKVTDQISDVSPLLRRTP